MKIKSAKYNRNAKHSVKKNEDKRTAENKIVKENEIERTIYYLNIVYAKV